MPWNLLILPLVSGYLLLTKLNHFKYRQQRLERQRLVFDSVLLGILAFTFTYILRLIVEALIPDIVKFLYNLFPFHVPLLVTSFVTLLLGWIAVVIGNLLPFFNKEKCVKRAIRKVGNELELLLLSSVKEKRLLQFTLKNNKTYVGWVKELSAPRTNNFIRIIPAISGYRNDKMNVEYNTHYLAVYSEYIKEGETLDIKNLKTDLIIFSENIVSVSYFDLEMYNKFNIE